MKQLATIIALGTVVFMAVAMVQEWDVFAPWLGLTRQAPAPLPSPESEREAGETVRSFLERSSDLYRASGARVFTTTIPASSEVIADLIRDVDFLNRYGKREELRLLQLDILSTRLGSESDAELSTRERWEIRIVDAGAEDAAAPASVQTLYCTYQLARVGERWTVTAWRQEEPPAPRG